jgi:hypothetical protein
MANFKQWTEPTVTFVANAADVQSLTVTSGDYGVAAWKEGETSITVYFSNADLPAPRIFVPGTINSLAAGKIFALAAAVTPEGAAQVFFAVRTDNNQAKLFCLDTGYRVLANATPAVTDSTAVLAKLEELHAELAAFQGQLPDLANAVATTLLSSDNLAGMSGPLGVPTYLALNKPLQNYLVYAARSGALWALQSPEFYAQMVGVLDALVDAPATATARREAARVALAASTKELYPGQV